jgi:hypothetical protein
VLHARDVWRDRAGGLLIPFCGVQTLQEIFVRKKQIDTTAATLGEISKVLDDLTHRFDLQLVHYEFAKKWNAHLASHAIKSTLWVG